MQEKQTNILEIAEKQRHLFLLQKVKQNKRLTSGELLELKQLESKNNNVSEQKPAEPRLSAKDKLSDIHQRFCEELIANSSMDGKSTYKAIYQCSDKAAESGASRLMAKMEIQAYIAELQRQRSERTKITADLVLQELAKLGFSNISNYLTFDSSDVKLKSSNELSKDQLASIVEVSKSKSVTGHTSIRFKLYDKIKALELIGKHLSMFVENVNHTFPEGCGVLVAPVQISKEDWSRQAKNNSNSKQGGKNAKNDRTANFGSDSVKRG